ncbi:MAG: translocation/assembly module TamB [Marinilabiliales bacterium]|nr:MAG: translocation/assembly module TamB [Marinilabiliales bacterium]
MKRKLKGIKKILKIAALAVLLISALPAGVYFLARMPSVQTYLTNQIARQVSENLDAKFEVGRVDIVFFNRVMLSDIIIEDQRGDILLRAERITVTINHLNRARRSIGFNQILMNNAVINLASDADSVLNLQFIIDAVASDDTTRTGWDFEINAVYLKNSSFTYRAYDPEARESGIDFGDIGITRLNLLVDRIKTSADTVFFNIRYLNLKEKSGFTVDHFSSENTVSPAGIRLDGLRIMTPYSRLDLEHYQMAFNDFADFKDFVGRVTLSGHFRPSWISFNDLAYFAPGLKEVDLTVRLSGEAGGRVSNLRGTGLNIEAFDGTSMTASFNMIGLPDIDQTFMFFDLDNLSTSAADIMKVVSAVGEPTADQAPEILANIGDIDYRGKFTGFIDDFVAYGELTTGIGSVITDLALQPDTDNTLNFSGRMRAVHFDAGLLSGADLLGRITFNAETSGQITTGGAVYADLDGTIDSVRFNEYTYKNIKLAGEVANRRYSGSAHINDPNIILDFLGSIDISDEIPEFDFSANVSDANMYNLNIEKDEPGTILSFLSTASFRGNSPDNLSGRVDLVNARFTRDEQYLQIENLSLQATGTGENREIILSSDLADGYLAGNYEFATITSSINTLVNKYIPSYAVNYKPVPDPSGNDFSFDLHLKETEEFTSFFFPDLYFASGTTLKGVYDPASYLTAVNAQSDEVRINNHVFSRINIETNSTDSLFNFSSAIERLLFANRFEIENISIRSGIINDSTSFHAAWDNREKIRYKGEINAGVTFERRPGQATPLVTVDIMPSDIYIADTLWTVEQSRAIIDSSSYQIEDFVFGMPHQKLMLNGKLSEDPLDSIHLEFHDMELRTIELIATPGSFHLAGIVNGKASLSDIHANPLFGTNLKIEDLTINHQVFGDMDIITKWLPESRSIAVHTHSERDGDRIINMEGQYTPDGNLLDFEIELAKINLRTFDGYIDEVFGNLRGLAGGNLRLEGNLRQPRFNGNILLQKASFMIDYLKTSYNFTHEVEIRDNDIIFNDIVVYDANHNTCRASGRVSHTWFRDFSLNIHLYPERFMALNTMERDNEQFYGRVFASGLVHITGPVDNIIMNISARTDRNTQFFIPLHKSSEVGELHFLSFTGSADNEAGIEPVEGIRNYEVDLSGIQLSFDLDVTPDAEVQIIFDSKIGDIIRGRGSGSFKMEINTLGQFSMFGEYTIEQGDYLFTLQNVINKRFEIERGGRINWNGDPFDANIDMKAVYRLRTSPAPLLAQYGTSDAYTRRIPVECHIIMRENLMTPDITFDIDLPTADPDTRRNIQGILSDEEKRNRQFLALLVINNFIVEEDLSGPGMGANLGMSATEASITTVSEFFSNQLSNWLSQLSRDIDFGVNWRPGDEITPDEVELALSTQVLNDRVRINGNVDVGGRQMNTSNIVGDFDVDIKLNRSGKLRLKAFTRANDNLIRTHLSPYTQGVGLFYREDFDSFDELMRRYWNMVFAEAKREEEASEP